ncbi:MAG: hypothetical protein LBE50_04225 [Gallionellaceae bacterium]|jgi:hypothetical protein|nr:hypothetical protein [Gallionellaceae bacterium]
MMHRILARCALGLMLISAQPAFALDSYRFLHVTIDTPWAIFVFLLFAVLAPFALMAILVWRYAEHRIESKKRQENEQ